VVGVLRDDTWVYGPGCAGWASPARHRYGRRPVRIH
ncbi:uncharacterized protein METZ01_LOCUS464287, partial [marine metagenome]